MHQAFILGAGLGTRLRPLTNRLPKPLIPLFHRSLAERAMETCAAAGVQRFAINTHHLPEEWRNEPFGLASPFWKTGSIIGGNGLPTVEGSWRGLPVDLFAEPVLLETGGGLKNIGAWMEDGPLLIHNGDIFTTLPLHRLMEAHRESGLPVTLALRSEGDAKHIALKEGDAGGKVFDIRNLLGRAQGTHVFTGIYCVDRSFLDLLPVGEKASVIPAFLELAKQGRLGSVTLDGGVWMDLGDRKSYLDAHRTLSLDEPIHPEARIDAGAVVEGSVIGPHAVIEAGAVVRNSVVWAGARIHGNAMLDGCIVYSRIPVTGTHSSQDL